MMAVVLVLEEDGLVNGHALQREIKTVFVR